MIVYKKDSKDRIRFLEVFADGAELVQRSGLVDGAVVENRSTCKAKNIGKVNETTPEQQAELEAISKIETKRSQGYFDSIEEAENEVVILPMLAKDFKKEEKKVKYPCYAQPKLDGMRATCVGGKFISRKGKEIDTIRHITIDSNLIYDGELYVHGESFQENMRLIKKYREGESERIKFCVYDVVSNEPYSERVKLLRQLATNPDVEIVETLEINSKEELLIFHKKNLREGYEGTIIRHSDAGYEANKRSSSLLKYKDFMDIDAEILDIIPNEKNPKQGTPLLVYKEKEFKAGVKMSHKDREELLANKKDYIGKKANIRFFEYTDDLIPRFPIMIGVHEDR